MKNMIRRHITFYGWASSMPTKKTPVMTNQQNTIVLRKKIMLMWQIWVYHAE